jgi:biopolymer transport protein ExbD
LNFYQEVVFKRRAEKLAVNTKPTQNSLKTQREKSKPFHICINQAGSLYWSQEFKDE